MFEKVLTTLAFFFLIISEIRCQYDTSGFTFKQRINITSETNLEEEDVLINLNTKSMVEKDEILSDCSDLIFIDPTTGDRISHYLENSCNSETSRFYITKDILGKGNGTNYIDMYFRANNPANLAEPFEGNFLEFRNTPCQNGWENEDLFDGKLPFIDSSNVGEYSKGINVDHSHFLLYFSGEKLSSTILEETLHHSEDEDIFAGWQIRGNTNLLTGSSDHSHIWIHNTEKSNLEEVLPSFKEHYVCRNKKLDFSKNSIGIFTRKNEISEYYSFYEGLNPSSSSNPNYFIIGGNNNKTGGNQFHSHSYTNGESIKSTRVSTVEYANYIRIKKNYQFLYYEIESVEVASNDHIHSIIDGETEKGSNIPENRIDFILGTRIINDDIVTKYNALKSGLIMTTKLPPKGFEINTDYNGYFLGSAKTENDFLINGNSGLPKISHLHTFTPEFKTTEQKATASKQPQELFTYEQYSSTQYYCDRYSVRVPCYDINSPRRTYVPSVDHLHQTITTDSDNVNVELPHFNVMLVQRKPIHVNLTFGAKEQVGAYFTRDEIIIPSNCNPECLNGGKCEDIIINGTETWICNCTDKFKGEDCSIFIDSPSSFNALPLIIIAVSSGIVFLCFLLIILGIVIFLTILMLKKKRDANYNSKMINSIVANAEKEEELQEENLKLQEEKQKLESDRQKLEEEKEKEKEEKEQLKKDLEKLKQEKEKLMNGENSVAKITRLQRIPKTEIKNQKSLMKIKNGYQTFKAQYKGNDVMYRLFDPTIFKINGTNTKFNPLKSLELEINEYARYFHPNITSYQGYHISTKNSEVSFGVVTEWNSNGPIKTYFSRSKRKRFKFLQKVRIFYEICNAIHYLHKQGIPHGDVNAENIFLTKELRPKLDFGFNKTFSFSEHIYSQYSAPELIIPQEFEYDDDDDIEDSPHLKADVYAFGILMFQIVSENFNLYKISNGKKEKIGEKVANSPTFRPPIGKFAKYYPNWFINIIKMCWNAEPQRRPSISRIKTIIETIVFEEKE